MRLCEMVGRALARAKLHARTIQLKLRYNDFSTITRAHSLPAPRISTREIFEQVRALFRKNWKAGGRAPAGGARFVIRGACEQLDLIEGRRQQRWNQALAAADRLRDKFGESTVSLAAGLRGSFRERTHENPAGLPGRK